MDARLLQIVSRSECDAVMAPIESALTLPAQSYTDNDWFDLEVERIFRRNWLAVLFDCALPEPGDAQPFELFGMPLLALRGADRNLRIFHNICPYDGCLAVRSAETKLAEIEVYYHGWRYDLQGRLVDAPFWSGRRQIDSRSLNGHNGDLVEIRSAVRLGVVFVDLDGAAPDIDAWLAPWMKTVTRDYAVDRLVPARGADGKPLIETRTVDANWKTYQENASINILHEAFTHELYRKSPEVPRVDADGVPGFELFMEGSLVAFGHSRQKSGKTYDPIHLPTAGHDVGRQPDWGYFTTLFPNLNVPLLDAFIKINIAIPVSPGSTRLQHLRFYSPEALADPRFLDEETAVQRLFDTIHHEDRLAIEAVQQGRSSPVWRQHFYAPFWDRLHHRFNQLVMSAMMRP
jgi:choline monooxygenase